MVWSDGQRMYDGQSRIRHGSPRGEELVAAWNRSDLGYIVDRLALMVTLDSQQPRLRPADTDLMPTSKVAFAAGLAAYPAPLPAFEIVALFENPDTICFVLRDGDGDTLSVTVELDAAGKIGRIDSYRLGRDER